MLDYHSLVHPIPVVLVLVHDRAGHVVMMRRQEWPEGWWGLIAGFIEPGETAEEAAAREVKEETGLSVELETFLGTFRGERFPDQIYLAFAARALSSGLQAGDDAELVAWFDALGAPAWPGSPAAQVMARWLVRDPP